MQRFCNNYHSAENYQKLLYQSKYHHWLYHTPGLHDECNSGTDDYDLNYYTNLQYCVAD